MGIKKSGKNLERVIWLDATMILFSLVVVATAFFFNPGLTGFISEDKSVHSIELNKLVTNNSEIEVGFDGRISSLMISGKVIGEGSAKVYVKDGENLILVFDSAALSNRESHLTALAVDDAEIIDVSTTTALDTALTSLEVTTSTIEVTSILEETSTTSIEETTTIIETTSTSVSSSTTLESTTTEESSSSTVEITTTTAVEGVSSTSVSTSLETTTTTIKEISFDDICIDSCSFIHKGEIILFVELDGASLQLDKVSYTLKENSAPVYIGPEIITIDSSTTINLSNYFNDPDNDSLTFLSTSSKDLMVDVLGSMLTVGPVDGFVGETKITLIAGDQEKSSIQKVIVNVTPSVESLVQLPAEIGKPVVWVKKMKTKDGKAVVSVPKGSKINKHEGDIKEKKVDKEKKEKEGLLSDEIEYEELEIENAPVTIQLEYETPAPEKHEEELDHSKKRVTVFSDYHYTNITSYATLPIEANKENIQLYHYNNNVKEPVEITQYLDTNNNKLIDTIYWIVPHTSNETYEITIIILNVQSYPTVGGNWTVLFNTTGTANLTITAINETTWSTDNITEDLLLLEIRCGEENKTFDWQEGVALIENYNCDNKTGTETSKVLTAGTHNLKFTFGDLTAYANNWADNGTLEQYIDDCGNLTTENAIYYLNKSVNSTGTCFNITANNITLDCMGYEINYSSSAVGYGVTSYNTSLIIIHNCTILTSSTSYTYAYGIYLLNVTNGTAQYNRITTYGQRGSGIYNLYSHGTRLNNNTINATNWQSSAILVAYSQNLTFTNNYAETNQNPPYSFDGTNFNQHNHIIGPDNLAAGKPVNYTANCQNQSFDNVDFSSYGQVIFAGCNNITLTNVTIQNYGLYLVDTHRSRMVNSTFNTINSQALIIRASSNNILDNNNIYSAGWAHPWAIYLSGGSSNNTVSNSVIISNATVFFARGFTTSSGPNRNNIVNNTIITYGPYGYGFSLGDDNNFYINNNNITINGTGTAFLFSGTSNNNTMVGNTINLVNQSNSAVYVNSGSHNFTVRDTIINSYGAQKSSLEVTNSTISGIFNFTNTTIVNVTFKNAANGTINVHWYIDVNVTDSSGSPISSALVQAWDNESALKYSQYTTADGSTNRSAVLSYWQNSSEIRNFSILQVNASKTGYTTSTQLQNLTANLIVNITLGAYPSVVLNSPLNNSVVGNNITLNFTPLTSSGFSNCSLWHNISGTWALNQTNYSAITSGNWYHFNLSNIANKTMFIWNIQCYDQSGADYWNSSNWTLRVQPALEIWDQTDARGGSVAAYPGEIAMHYANLTDATTAIKQSGLIEEKAFKSKDFNRLSDVFDTVYTSDIDLDGVPEIVAGGYGTNANCSFGNATCVSGGGSSNWVVGIYEYNSTTGIISEKTFISKDFNQGTDAVSSLYIYDVDLDGTPEIVAGGYGTNANCSFGNGTCSPASSSTYAWVLGIYEYNATTNILSERAFISKTFSYSSGLASVYVYDFDLDGVPEILVGGTGYSVNCSFGNSTCSTYPSQQNWLVGVYEFNSTSGFLSEKAFLSKHFGADEYIRSVSIADIDLDGAAEIVAGGYGNGANCPYGNITCTSGSGVENMILGVYEYNSTTNLLSERAFLTKNFGTLNEMINSVYVTDLDLDGTPEIIVGGDSMHANCSFGNTTCTTISGTNGHSLLGVYGFNRTSGLLYERSFLSKFLDIYSPINSVYVSDVDLDSIPEIVTGGIAAYANCSFGNTTCTTDSIINNWNWVIGIYEFNSTTGILSDKAFLTKDFNNYTLTYDVLYSIIVSDIDLDGVPEVVAGGYGDGGNCSFGNMTCVSNSSDNYNWVVGVYELPMQSACDASFELTSGSNAFSSWTPMFYNVSSGLNLEGYQYPASGTYAYNVSCSNGYLLANDTITITADSTPPVVTLLRPINLSWSNYQAVWFYFNVTDAGAIKNCSLWNNRTSTWAYDKQYLGTVNPGSTNYSIPIYFGVEDGTEVLWNIQCFDWGGNSDWGDNNVTVFVDNLAPAITLNQPNNGGTDNDGNISLNFTVTETNLANCSLWTNISGSWVINMTNATAVTNNTPYLFNITGLPTGLQFIWNVICFDKAANSNWYSQNWTLSIDIAKPNVILNQPLNMTYVSNTGNVSLNFTVTESNIANCSLWTNISGTFAINMTNATAITSGAPYLFNMTGLSSGLEFYWNVICFDVGTLSNWSASNWTVHIDATSPVVTLNQPPNATVDYDGNISLNFTVTEINLANCSLWSNISGTWAINATNASEITSGIPYIFNITGLGSGVEFYWNVMCSDKAGNSARNNANWSITFINQSTSSCGNLSTANTIYYLTQNVSFNGTCFNITANNITLDCQGYEINYSSSSAQGYGVFSNMNNSVVKNCVIVEGVSTTSQKHAFNFLSARNGTVLNNTIRLIGSYSYGVHLYTSKYFIIEDNLISSKSEYSTIYIFGHDSNHTIRDNLISTTGGAAGIFLWYTDYTWIINNSISNSNVDHTTYNSGTGIAIGYSPATFLYNNSVNTTSSIGYGVIGSPFSEYNQTIGTDNLAEGKPVNYTFNAQNQVYSNIDFTQYGEVLFVWSNNITVQNSNFSDDSLLIINTSNSLIQNNFLNTTNSYGFYVIQGSQNNIIDRNTINTLGNRLTGITNNGASYNNYTNNFVTTNGSSSHGMSFSESSNNGDYNLAVNNTVTCYGSGTTFVYRIDTVDYITSINNTLNTFSSWNYGYYLTATIGSSVTGGSVKTTSTTGYGLFITGSKDINVGEISINTTDSDNAGIYLASSSNVTINKTSIYTTSNSPGIKINSGSVNASFFDTYVNASQTSDILFVDGIMLSTVNFTNVTFSEANFTTTTNNGILNVHFWLDVNVTDGVGVGIDAATISGWDKFGTQSVSGTTNGGLLSRLQVFSYWQNASESYYYSNYTINASKTGYIAGSQSVNMTGNAYLNFTLQSALTSCQNLTTANMVYYLTQNVTGPDTCFNITANNITLDCQGFEINYSYTGTRGYGVHVIDRNVSTIKNCVIKEGNSTTSDKHAILNVNSDYVTINNNTIVTIGDSYGYYGLSTPHFLTFSNNTVTSHSLGMWLYGGGTLSRILNNTITSLSTGGVYTLTTVNVTIYGNKIVSNGSFGILLGWSTNSNVTANEVNSTAANSYDVEGGLSDYNTILGPDNLAEGLPVNFTEAVTNITYSGIDFSGYGQVLIRVGRNVTYDNCTFSNDGLMVIEGRNVTVMNSRFNSSTGVSLWIYHTSYNITVINNTITNDEERSNALRLTYDTRSVEVSNNNITKTTTSDVVFLDDTRNIFINRNIINSYASSCDAINVGGSRALLVSNNTIVTNGTSSSGVQLFYSNTIISIIDNNITTTGTSSPGLFTDSQNLYFRGYTNSTWYAIYGYYALTNFTIEDSYLISGPGYRVIDLAGSINATIIDTYLSNSNTTSDIYLGASFDYAFINLTNVTFDNITFLSGATGNAYVNWYLDVNVTDSVFSPINGAAVTAADRNLTQLVSTTTGSNGAIPRQTVQSYWRNASLSYYYSNYTISASALGYFSSSQSVNLSGNLALNFSLLTNLSACSNLSIANMVYYLTQNVTNEGTCMNITANNVTLDCQGYGIFYNTGGSSNVYGIYNSKYNYTTIKNCIINQSSSSGSYSYNVYLGSNSYNVTLLNNTMAAGSTAVYATSSSYFNISNNSMNVVYTKALELLSSQFGFIYGNNFTGSGDSSPSIYVYGLGPSHYNHTIGPDNFVNNLPVNYTFNAQNVVYSGVNYTGYGLVLFGWAVNLTINSSQIGGQGLSLFSATNTTVMGCGINSSTSAVYVTGYNNSVNITGNYLNATWSGVYVDTYSNGHYITNNIINNPNQGIFLIYSASNTIANNYINASSVGITIWSSNHNYFVNNTLIQTCDGVRVSYGSNNNTLSRMNITTSLYSWCNAINYYQGFAGSSGNTSVFDSYLNANVAGAYDIGFNYDFGFVNLTNVTFTDINYSTRLAGTINVHNYLDVQVNDTAGNPIDAATVLGYDKDGLERFNSTTSNGRINRLPVFYYWQNYSEIYYLNNYTANTSKTGYIAATQSVNVSTNQLINFTLYSALDFCQNLTQANIYYYLTQNITGPDTCFNITANNVTVDCQGYEINYSYAGTSGYGFYIKYSNLSTIKNCVIKQGNSTGGATSLYLSGARNVYFNNNSIISFNAIGIGIYDSSINVTISNNTITGKSNYGIRPYQTTYVKIMNNTITRSSSGSPIAFATSSNPVIYGNKLNSNTSNAIAFQWTSGVNLTNNEANSTYHNSIEMTGPSTDTMILGPDNLVEGLPVNFTRGAQNITYSGIDFSSYGQVIFKNAKNVTFDNCTFANDGLMLIGCINVTVQNSRLNSSTGIPLWIYYESYNITINNNTITSENDNTQGLLVTYACRDIYINNNNITKTTTGDTVYLGVRNVILNGNTINSYAGTSCDAVHVQDCRNITFINNIIFSNTSSSYGIDLYYGDTNITVINTTITTTGAFTAGILLRSEPLYFQGIINSTYYSMIGSYAISNLTIEDSVLYSGAGYRPLYINSNLNITIKNTYLSNSNISSDIYLDSSFDNAYINLTNVTFDNMTIVSGATGTVYVNYYMDVNVTDSVFSPINGALVSASDTDGLERFSTTTGPSGSIPRQTVQSYWRNYSHYYNLSNYTVTVSALGYFGSTQSVNVSSNLALNFSLLTNITSCQNLTTANMVYYLTQNVTNESTCFYIKANNVTLDCRGYEINYSFMGIAGYGVYSDYNNSVIRNCRIFEGNSTTSYKYGIYFEDNNGGTIFNNTVVTNSTSSSAIYIDTSDSNIILNNSLTSNGTSVYAVMILQSFNNTFQNNSAITLSGSGYGITAYSFSMANNSIDGSNLAEDKPVNFSFNINNMIFNGIDFSSFGQVIFAGCNNITINNSNFTDDGLFFTSTNNLTLSNNFINTSKGYGISFYGGQVVNITNNIINTYGYGQSGVRQLFGTGYYYSGNMITTYDSSAFPISQGREHNLVVNNTLLAYKSYAFLLGVTRNNTIINSNITSNNTRAVYISYSNANLSVTDTILSSPSGTDEISISSAAIVNFTNVSFTGVTFQTGNGILYVNYYLDANVTNSVFSPINGASVTANDKDSTERFSTTTGTNGAITRQTLLSYWQNASESYYYSNYTVSVSASGYFYSSQSVNLTGNLALNFSLLTNITSCQNLTTANMVYYLTQNVTSEGTCFYLQANNITLDCQGYQINYSMAGSSGNGVRGDSYHNLTIKNCVINEGNSSTNQKHAIVLINSFTSQIINNTIMVKGTDVDGIYISDPRRNIIDSNIINVSGSAAGSFSSGIYLTVAHGNGYNTIKNNRISVPGKGMGISIYYTDFTNITNNTVSVTTTGYYYGMWFGNSYLSRLYNNSVTTPYGMSYFWYGTNQDNYHVIGPDNLADGLPVNYSYNLQNVILDGIDYSGYGQVIFTRCNNLTVKNSNFSSDTLTLFDTTNSSFVNNTMNTSTGYGIFVNVQSIYNYFYRNNVTTYGAAGLGLAIDGASRNNYTGCRFTTNGVGSTGIYITYPTGNANYNYFKDDIITTYGNSSNGIYVGGSNYDQLINLSVRTYNYSSKGIYFYSSTASSIINTTVETFGSSSNGLDIWSDNTTMINVFVNASGSGSRGLYLWGANYNILNQSQIYNNDSTSIYSYDGVSSITSYDTIIERNIYFYSDDGSIFNFTNVSFMNVSWYSSSIQGIIYSNYYLDVNVTDSVFSPINGATVTATDKNTNQWFSSTTGTNGAIPREIVLSYWKNASESSYYSNYSIAVSALGYFGSTQSVNVSSNLALNFSLLTNITSCQNLTTANMVYYLTQNVTNESTCFYIKANNVTLDCQGYAIFNYSYGSTGYAVYNYYYNYTVLRNCLIIEGVSNPNDKIAVYWRGVKNGTIFNNTIITIGDWSTGIALGFTATYTNVSSNTVNTSSIQAAGISVGGAPYTNLFNNSVYSSKTSSYYITADYAAEKNQTFINNLAEGKPINFSTGLSNVAFNNVDFTGFGQVICLGCNNVSYNNCNFTDDGLLIVYSDNITVNGNWFNSSKGHGIYAGDTGTNNVYSNNVINVTGNKIAGINIVGDKNVFVNNSISTYGTSAYGIWLWSDHNNFTGNSIQTYGTTAYGVQVRPSKNNTFSKDTILTNQSAVIYLSSGAVNLSVIDSVLDSNNGSYELQLYSSVSSGIINFTNVSFYNVTFASGPTAVLNVNYYLDVIVNDSFGNLIDSANITANDRDGVQKFSVNSTIGSIARQTVLSYWQNSTQTYYYSNFNVSASKSGYSSNFSFVNLTSNLGITLILNTPPLVSLSSPLNNSWLNSSIVYLNFTNTDTDMVNCSLWTNISGVWAINQTNTSAITSGTKYQFNLTGLSNGLEFIWNVYCLDSALAGDWYDQNWTIHIDTQTPNIFFQGQTPGNDSYLSQNSIFINTSTSDNQRHYSFTNFDNSLLLWLRMDNNNGTHVLDESGYGNNMILVNGTSISQAGYYGKTIILDGIDDHAHIDDSASLHISNNFTLSFWIKINKGPGVGQYLTLIRSGDNLGCTLEESDNSLWCYVSSNIVGYNWHAYDLPLNVWTNVIYTYNGTGRTLYVNGTLANIKTTNGTLNTVSTNQWNIGGTLFSQNNTFNGTIDEVMIFNHSLSADEVLSLYNGSQYFHNFTSLSEGNHSFQNFVVDAGGNKNQTDLRTIHLDVVIPNVLVNDPTPLNNSYIRASSFIINFTATDSNIANCSIYTNHAGSWLRNQTNVSALSAGVPYQFNLSGLLSDSSFYWDLLCVDKAGNSNWSNLNRTVNIDYTYPLVSLISPTDDQVLSNLTVIFNYSVDSASNCTLYHNSSGVFIANITNNGTPFTVTFDNNYTILWNVLCTDLANNQNFSSINYTLRLDTGIPQVSLLSPEDNSYSNSNNLSLTFLALDDSLVNCSLYTNLTGSWIINQTNTSLISGNYSFNLSDLPDTGFLWNILCIDSAGSLAYAINNFSVTVDTTKPIVTLISPENDYADDDGNLLFNFTVNETNLKICNFYTDTINSWSINASNNSPISDSYTFNLTGLPEGTYHWAIECIDNANNYYVTQNRTFSVSFSENVEEEFEAPGIFWGGGGGASPQFSVSPAVIKLKIIKGESKEAQFNIRSRGYSVLDLSVNGVSGLSTSLSTYSLGLNAKEQAVVTLTVDVPKTAKTGVYVGEIIISSPSGNRKIGLIIDVVEKESKISLDTKVSTTPDFKTLAGNVEILGLKSSPEDIISVKYTLLDSFSNIVYSKDASVDLGSTRIISFAEDLEESLSPGIYVFIVDVKTSSGTAISSSIITIEDKKDSDTADKSPVVPVKLVEVQKESNNGIIYLILFINVILIFIVIVLFTMVVKRPPIYKRYKK